VTRKRESDLNIYVTISTSPGVVGEIWSADSFVTPPGYLDVSRAFAPIVVIEAPRSGLLIKDGREGSVFFICKGLLMISFCFVTEIIRRLYWW
jgi:hypothetical protein